MKGKHRNDKNHGRNGWVGGNPRHSRPKAKRQAQGGRYTPKLRSMGSN